MSRVLPGAAWWRVTVPRSLSVCLSDVWSGWGGCYNRIVGTISAQKAENSQSQKSQTSDSQSVVSSHGQVEPRLADVSLHSMNSLTRSSSKEFGIEQLDDIWGGGG